MGCLQDKVESKHLELSTDYPDESSPIQVVNPKELNSPCFETKVSFTEQDVEKSTKLLSGKIDKYSSILPLYDLNGKLNFLVLNIYT